MYVAASLYLDERRESYDAPVGHAHPPCAWGHRGHVPAAQRRTSLLCRRTGARAGEPFCTAAITVVRTRG